MKSSLWKKLIIPFICRDKLYLIIQQYIPPLPVSLYYFFYHGDISFCLVAEMKCTHIDSYLSPLWAHSDFIYHREITFHLLAEIRYMHTKYYLLCPQVYLSFIYHVHMILLICLNKYLGIFQTGPEGTLSSRTMKVRWLGFLSGLGWLLSICNHSLKNHSIQIPH